MPSELSTHPQSSFRLALQHRWFLVDCLEERKKRRNARRKILFCALFSLSSFISSGRERHAAHEFSSFSSNRRGRKAKREREKTWRKFVCLTFSLSLRFSLALPLKPQPIRNERWTSANQRLIRRVRTSADNVSLELLLYLLFLRVLSFFFFLERAMCVDYHRSDNLSLFPRYILQFDISWLIQGSNLARMVQSKMSMMSFDQFWWNLKSFFK